MLRTLQILGSAIILSGAIQIASLPSSSHYAMAHGDDDDFAAGQPGDSQKPSREIKLTMSEKDGAMIYSPSEVDVKLGEQIKFVIQNSGALKHEFFLASVQQNASHRAEMQKNPEMEHDDPNAQSVEPGKEAVILWRFSKPGEFEFACLIPGHYEAGMHGKVVVK